MQKTCQVSNLAISPFQNMQEAVKAIINEDNKINPGFAIAINAEKIISMRKKPEVREILESATLRYPDGIGVVWALNKKGAKSTRIPGCELWEELMKTAGQQNIPVFIIGAKPDTLEATEKKLQSEFNVNLVGSQHGYFDDELKLINQIKASGARIVTVALGSPKQEKFIAKCREIYPEAFYMGVGGTYDVFVGNVQRAPAWAQKYHLEWFYRLAKQPTRISRQTVYIHYMLLLLTNRL